MLKSHGCVHAGASLNVLGTALLSLRTSIEFDKRFQFSIGIDEILRVSLFLLNIYL